MPQILLSLGSNINRHENIQLALDALARHFDFLRISSVYETQAVGFQGQDFFNLAVAAHTKLSPAQINTLLKHIETQQGRDQQQKGFKARTIDIDLLTYGEVAGTLDAIEFPRDEIYRYAFVLVPLVEIAGEQHCPGTRNCYKELLNSANFKQQALQRVDFTWHNSTLPCSINTFIDTI